MSGLTSWQEMALDMMRHGCGLASSPGDMTDLQRREMDDLVERGLARREVASGVYALAEEGPKERAWRELEASGPRPPMMTPRRVRILKDDLWEDEGFWGDLLDRHGLRRERLDELEPEVREHAVGNFWGMLCGAWVRSGRKR